MKLYLQHKQHRQAGREGANANDIQVTVMEFDDSKGVEGESIAGSGPVLYFLK